MGTILDEILDHKRREIDAALARTPRAEMEARALAVDEPGRGFAAALAVAETPAVIAEIKRRSPSRGVIREDFEPVEIARAYARGGAAALSVLTDEHYFGGHLDFLPKVRAAVDLPLLRKDFVVDPYQIDEARSAGADAVLLIVAGLDRDEIAPLFAHASSRGLDVLVEVHDEAELEIALDTGALLLGVNNRDLRTFEVDLAVTERLASQLAARGADSEDRLLVSESGIHTPADIERLRRAGAGAFLVGESLMREPDVTRAVEALRRTE